MVNKGVKGRVVDATDPQKGIAGLVVKVVNFDPAFNDNEVLKTGKTDENGRFNLTYSPFSYGIWMPEMNPELVVRIYNSDFRLLYETKEKKDVTDEILEVEEIAIHKNNIEGWLVTNATLNPEKGEPVAFSTGNRIEYLIDGDTMFPAITDAVVSAKTSINLMTLFFQVDDPKSDDKKEGIITKFKNDFDYTNPPSTNCQVGIEYRLDEELKKKADDFIPVKLLLADIPISPSDTVKEAEDYFKNSFVEVNDFNKNFSLLHTKALIVDHSKAILMGSPIKQGYFNDKEHLIFDARNKGRLLHDVSIQVEGPAVASIERTFATIWNTTSGLPVELPAPEPPQETDSKEAVAVQVLRTLPGQTFKEKIGPPHLGSHLLVEELPHGETGILEAYQRAIAKAEKFIYFENQYFTSPEIVSALKHRMKNKNKPKLQLIFVINFRPDLPGYPERQMRVIDDLEKVAEKYEHQLGVYTLWSRVEPNDIEIEDKEDYDVEDIYVHSKVAIIDDVWATIGSANLDGTSLNYHQFSLMASAAIFERAFKSLMDLHFVQFDDFFKLFWDTLFYVLGQLIKVYGGYFLRLIVATIGIMLKILTDFEGFLKSLGDIWEAITDLSYTELKGIYFDLFIRTSEHALPNRSKQPSRSAEMNLVIYNGVEGLPETDQITTLRKLLSIEHECIDDSLSDYNPYKLAIKKSSQSQDQSEDQAEDEPTLTWVEHWDKVAAENLEAIKMNQEPLSSLSPRLLKWTPEKTSLQYLRALGVGKKKLKTKKIKYSFDSCEFGSDGFVSKLADRYPTLFL